MRARRTHQSNQVLSLEGGTEDNDLHVRIAVDEASGVPAILSVWQPTSQERESIANGGNIELIVLGYAHPPVAMRVTDVPLGKAP